MNRLQLCATFFCVAFLAMLAAPRFTLATTFSYGFDGTLSDHFAPFFGDTEFVFSQQNDQLEFHNNGADGISDSGAGLVHTDFRPRYDQSWSASLQVTVPLSYDDFPGNPPPGQGEEADEFVSAGIAAAFIPSGNIDDPTSRFLVPLLEVRRFPPEIDPQRVLVIDGSSGVVELRETPVGTARLEISFDSETKELTVAQDGLPLQSVAINDSFGNDWNMSESDTFQFVIIGDAKNEPVSSQNPLLYDEFRAAIGIPEPASLLLLIGCVCFTSRWRREVC